MIRFFLPLAGLTLVAVAAARAEPPPLPKAEVDAILLGYIEWITANSDFEYAGEPLPGIHLYDQEFLQEMFHGAEVAARARAGGVELTVIDAIYDHTSDDILLPLGFDLHALETGHVLVHELVHYLQDLRGEHARTDCLTELEWPAYQIHMKWMDEHESPADRPNMLWVMIVRMGCNEDPGAAPN